MHHIMSKKSVAFFERRLLAYHAGTRLRRP
jgi:hypothetical protein